MPSIGPAAESAGITAAVSERVGPSSPGTPGADATKLWSISGGSTISVDIKLDGDRVSDYGQTVKACLLGQAAASIMARGILGSDAEELREVGAAMRRMLKANGPPPGGRWADLAVLEPVRDFKARHASTLLVFDAVETALAEVEAKRGVPERAARADGATFGAVGCARGIGRGAGARFFSSQPASASPTLQTTNSSDARSPRLPVPVLNITARAD